MTINIKNKLYNKPVNIFPNFWHCIYIYIKTSEEMQDLAWSRKPFWIWCEQWKQTSYITVISVPVDGTSWFQGICSHSSAHFHSQINQLERWFAKWSMFASNVPPPCVLTHWPLEGFDEILDDRFSKSFLWLVNEFSLVKFPSYECHWTSLMISHHWFR